MPSFQWNYKACKTQDKYSVKKQNNHQNQIRYDIEVEIIREEIKNIYDYSGKGSNGKSGKHAKIDG